MIRETLGLTRTAVRDLQRLGGYERRGARLLTQRVLLRDGSWQRRAACGDAIWEWNTAERGRPLFDEQPTPLDTMAAELERKTSARYDD